MEDTYLEMSKRHIKEVKELRDRCEHGSVSDWQEEYWALGHSSGWYIRICNYCEEVITKRTVCMVCQDTITKMHHAYRMCKGCYEKTHKKRDKERKFVSKSIEGSGQGHEDKIQELLKEKAKKEPQFID